MCWNFGCNDPEWKKEAQSNFAVKKLNDLDVELKKAEAQLRERLGKRPAPKLYPAWVREPGEESPAPARQGLETQWRLSRAAARMVAQECDPQVLPPESVIAEAIQKVLSNIPTELLELSRREVELLLLAVGREVCCRPSVEQKLLYDKLLGVLASGKLQ